MKDVSPQTEKTSEILSSRRRSHACQHTGLTFCGFIEQFAALLLITSVFGVLSACAQDWTIGPFSRVTSAPVISPDSASKVRDPLAGKVVHWEALNTFNPAAIVKDGKIFVLYRAEDDTGSMKIGGHTSRFGLAWSEDGIHFQRSSEPVFFPDHDAQQSREWPGGVEDPRLVEGPSGLYVLTYTQWNRKNTSIGIATSTDLHHWTKYGPAFPNSTGPAYEKYKSAGIVTELEDGRLKAARINGKYWMYWGEVEVHLASSPDLIHWTPIEDAPNHPVTLLGRRPGLFDSAFPEVGPPPVLTSKGIVLIYNGKNGKSNGAKGLDPGAYSGGQALFATDNPLKLLDRTKTSFFKPELAFERSGQYPTGTTFLEGLVYFHNAWFLYYGCADSLVGVARSEQSSARVLVP